MDLADWLAALGAVATLGAFVVAAWQVSRLRHEALATRKAEILGVTVETQILVRPNAAESGTAQSRWVYGFIVHNPGHVPISQVEVQITFPVPVQRTHATGPPEDAGTVLDMRFPVVPARGQSIRRDRTVLVDHVHYKLLKDTSATVTFTTPDAGRIMTSWPSGAQGTDRSLRQRLSDVRVD